MKHRSLPVSLTAAAASLAVVAAAAAPAVADPPPDPGDSLGVQSGASLAPTDKVAPSLAKATGTVTAFVELDAPSAVDLAALVKLVFRRRATSSRSRRPPAAPARGTRSRCR